MYVWLAEGKEKKRKESIMDHQTMLMTAGDIARVGRVYVYSGMWMDGQRRRVSLALGDDEDEMDRVGMLLGVCIVGSVHVR